MGGRSLGRNRYGRRPARPSSRRRSTTWPVVPIARVPVAVVVVALVVSGCGKTVRPSTAAAKSIAAALGKVKGGKQVNVQDVAAPTSAPTGGGGGGGGGGLPGLGAVPFTLPPVATTTSRPPSAAPSPGRGVSSFTHAPPPTPACAAAFADPNPLPGTSAVLRVASNVAAAAVSVTVAYRTGSASYSGRTDAQGQATVGFAVPSVADAGYVVAVTVDVGGRARCSAKFVVPHGAP